MPPSEGVEHLQDIAHPAVLRRSAPDRVHSDPYEALVLASSPEGQALADRLEGMGPDVRFALAVRLMCGVGSVGPEGLPDILPEE